VHYPAEVGPQRGPASVRQIEAQTKAIKKELAAIEDHRKKKSKK
jgi:hypothetical protein